MSEETNTARASCTEPERWARTPDHDAPEDEVERYLAHVDVCPYHAGIEAAEQFQAHALGLAALTATTLDPPTLTPGDRTRMGEQMQTLEAARAAAANAALSVRVNGKTVARMGAPGDVTSLEVATGSVVSIWTGEGHEAYSLGAWIIPESAEPSGRGTLAAIPLGKGGSVRPRFAAVGDATVRLTLTRRGDGVRAAVRGALGRVTAILAGGDGSGRSRRFRPAVIAGLMVMLLGLLSLSLLIRRAADGSDGQETAGDPTATDSAPPEIVDPNPGHGTGDVRPPGPAPPDEPRRPEGPRPPDSRKSTNVERPSQGRNGNSDGPRQPVPSPRPARVTLATARSIYVSGDDPSTQNLRDAVVDELKENGRFEIASNARDADVILRLGHTRGIAISMQASTRDQAHLWSANKRATPEGGLATAAREAVRDLIRESTPAQSQPAP